MKPILQCTVALFCILAAPHQAAAQPDHKKAAAWYLPQTLSDANTTIGFEVDTTWHTVHGKTSGISGHARLPDSTDPSVVELMVSVPSDRLNTDDTDRDEKLREVIAASDFPQIVLNATDAKLACLPALTRERGECTDTLHAKLQIRSTISPIEIPVVIRADGDQFVISGSFRIRWADYGVEDPSIFLIATVDPSVDIRFQVVLAPDQQPKS